MVILQWNTTGDLFPSSLVIHNFHLSDIRTPIHVILHYFHLSNLKTSDSSILNFSFRFNIKTSISLIPKTYIFLILKLHTSHFCIFIFFLILIFPYPWSPLLYLSELQASNPPIILQTFKFKYSWSYFWPSNFHVCGVSSSTRETISNKGVPNNQLHHKETKLSIGYLYMPVWEVDSKNHESFVSSPRGDKLLPKSWENDLCSE